MGETISKVLQKMSSSNPKRLIMVGLDAAGKTTILNKLDLSEVISSVLKIGYLYGKAENSRLSITMWDLVLSNDRPLYDQFYEDAEGIIFVVDSNDRIKINRAREDLQKLIYNEKLRDLPLLVYANKQDFISAMSIGEIADKLGIQNIDKSLYIQECCAINGYGLFEGLEWILKTIQDKKINPNLIRKQELI